MITLYGFGPAFGVPDPSSFVLKVDAYLRMCGLEFTVHNDFSNLKKSPKGKLPFIHVSGSQISDSEAIIAELDARNDRPLDKWLNEEQRAWSRLTIKSLDENLYWCLVYSRWINADGWQRTQAALFGGLPPLVNRIVPKLVQRNVRNNLNKQGTGLHSEEEILAIADDALESLSIILGDKPYFMGDEVCNLDATAFGVLCQLLLANDDCMISPAARRHSNLVAYCERVANRYYPGAFECLQSS